MPSLHSDLQQRLAGLEDAGLRRALPPSASIQTTRWATPEGVLLNFSSNDYLGLAAHPAVCAAASRAALDCGGGAGASRLVCGSLTAHGQLERELASFKGTEAALTFSSGYATALGVIPALVGRGDFVVADRLAHACLIDGARLSGAKLRVFRHNDVADLDRILKWVRAQPPSPAASPGRMRALIVTESIFSMDGDRALLREIVEVKDRWDAWLLVDEAHATGILGPRRTGLIEELGLNGRVEVPMGTLGKALAAAGGFVAGSRTLCDFLVNVARSLIFSTAPPPATAAAASAALALVGGDEGAKRVAKLSARIREVREGLLEMGWTLPAAPSPIVPLRVGAEDDAMRLASAMRAEGFLIPGIRYPSVPRGEARLRVTLSASHDAEDVARLLAALGRAAGRTGVRPA